MEGKRRKRRKRGVGGAVGGRGEEQAAVFISLATL
jgi:hypothetical protein